VLVIIPAMFDLNQEDIKPQYPYLPVSLGDPDHIIEDYLKKSNY